MKINVVDRSGTKHELDAELPATLESVISQSGIENEFGICGGCCACSSCQCYLEQPNWAQLGEPDEDEKSLLDENMYSQSNSRLGCQLWLSEKMENWTFTIAPY